MDPMEIFLLCVGLGVLIVLGFLLKYICSRFCHERCSKVPRNHDCILPSDPRRHTIIQSSNSRLPSIVASNNPLLQDTYLPLLSTRATQPHALIRAEPTGPGEPAVFLTFNFSEDEPNAGRLDGLPTIQAYIPASLARRTAVLEENEKSMTYDEARDQPPKYEDIFPSGKELQTIAEEENSL